MIQKTVKTKIGSFHLMMEIKMIKQKELNIICGKACVGHATIDELLSIFHYVDELQELLDETDQDDYFGPEGWRACVGAE